jgi:hypothetical protein
MDVRLHPGAIELVPQGRKLWRLIGWQWQSLALIKLTEGLPHGQLLSSCAAWRGSPYGGRDLSPQRLLSRSTTTFRVISGVSYRLSFVHQTPLRSRRSALVASIKVREHQWFLSRTARII